MSNKDMTAEVFKQLKRREEENKDAIAKRVEVISKVLGLGMLAIGIAFVSAIAVHRFNDYSRDNEIVFNYPIRVEFIEPITIKRRDLVVVINKTETVGKVKTENTIEELACQRFDNTNCRIAIAIMKAESNGDNTAFNINTNGTIDLGLFQINSIHYKTKGCSLQEVSTIKGNIDCAYSIFKKSGWSAWSSFNNGAVNKFIK